MACTILTKVLPLLVPNVVGGTLNVVTHAVPELPQEKKEEKKRRGKEGSLLFSLDKLGSAWVATFDVPHTTLGTSNGIVTNAKFELL